MPTLSTGVLAALIVGVVLGGISFVCCCSTCIYTIRRIRRNQGTSLFKRRRPRDVCCGWDLEKTSHEENLTKDPEKARHHPNTTAPEVCGNKINLASPMTPSEISTPFIRLTECEDVFGPSAAHVRPVAEFDLGNILGAFPAPPETTPVWWLHRTPSRSKEKNPLCAWTSRTPPLNTSTPKQSVSRNVNPNSSPKPFPKKRSPGPSTGRAPPREDNSLGSDSILGVTFEAFPSPEVTPRAHSTPVLAKLAYPIACLAANNLPDTSPTLNIRSKSVNVFKGSGDVIQARALRLPAGHRNI